MEKQLIINSNQLETRIALLGNGSLEELFIERNNEQILVGNIFKGRVTRVLPGMNSAFVDIGLEKSAFLFGGDALDPMAFRQENTKTTLLEDFEEQKKFYKKPIEQIIKDGQDIIVQVSKEPLGSKGPRVTMYLSLAGRYLVLIPNFYHIGISRRIEDNAERERLKSLVSNFLPDHSGVILRTAATNCSEEDLQNDFNDLFERWEKLEKSITKAKSPSLLHKDLDMIQKVVRDLNNENISKIIVDDQLIYMGLQNFFQKKIPSAIDKLEMYQSNIPIFDIYGIEIDIARALSSRVELPSGGHLIIEQTEALTTFDVNTGKFVGKINAQKTILKTNLEAASKVVEQLKIRNIGGIIVIDFIDMENQIDQERIYEFLMEELKNDRSRTNVLKISDLGLVQMTRKRTSESLERKLTTPCPHCNGRGQVRTTETEANDLLREILRTHLHSKSKQLKVRIREDLKSWLDAHGSGFLKMLCEEYQLEIDFEVTNFSFKILREPPYEVNS